MINTEYPIVDWEVFQTECSNDPSPAFYFSLTPDLKRLLKDNNNWVQLKIKGTDSAYDNQIFLGFVDTSANMPNNRPNFYEVEGLYVFTLKTSWKGYPKNKGTFEIINGVLVNYKKDDLIEKTENLIKNDSIENYKKEKKEKRKLKHRKNDNCIYLIVLLAILLIIISIKK